MWRQMGHLHLQFSLKIVDDRQKLTFCAQQYILCNVFIKLWMRSVGFLSPETHFLCSVIYFMRCYVKIVDE